VSDGPGHAGEIAHGSLRGAIAAAAMTGMRVLTVELGLVGETPPRAIARQRARGLMKRVPRRRRRAALELSHWAYGHGEHAEETSRKLDDRYIHYLEKSMARPFG